jgi:hypothetical protein
VIGSGQYFPFNISCFVTARYGTLWLIANQSCSILQLAGFLLGDFLGLALNMGDAIA